MDWEAHAAASAYTSIYAAFAPRHARWWDELDAVPRRYSCVYMTRAFIADLNGCPLFALMCALSPARAILDPLDIERISIHLGDSDDYKEYNACWNISVNQALFDFVINRPKQSKYSYIASYIENIWCMIHCRMLWFLFYLYPYYNVYSPLTKSVLSLMLENNSFIQTNKEDRKLKWFSS